MSLTESELITSMMANGLPTKMEFFLKLVKIQTTPLISKEKSTSMSNLLPTRSKSTSQLPRELERMDTSAEDLMS
jgi:hypothetical protein